MRKKVTRQKDIKTGRDKQCLLCFPTQPHLTLTYLPPHNLKNKYYYPQIDTYHFRAINNFFYDPYSLEAVQLAEMRKQCSKDQTLKRYFSFGETVQSIKAVITRRVEKDFYGWVDFQKEHFAITNVYYLRRKQLVQTGRKIENYLKNTSELQSTGSGDNKHVRQYIRQKIKKQLDQQRLVRPNDTNSIIDLQKLTRNIETMVEKIADLSAIHPLPRQKRNPSQQKKTAFQFSCKQIPEINCKQISEIEKVEERQQFRQPNNYQESYGLQTIKPKLAKQKKLNKMTLRSMDRINGFDEFRQPPETPSPRMIHRLNYAEEEQLAHNRNSSNKLPPLSPNNHSSSSLRSKNSNSNRKLKSSSRKK